ncbi:MAG: hypothetical protein AVDCRST_MAG56-853, partial [uncultured Cytophagales bacterium]
EESTDPDGTLCAGLQSRGHRAFPRKPGAQFQRPVLLLGDYGQRRPRRKATDARRAPEPMGALQAGRGSALPFARIPATGKAGPLHRGAAAGSGVHEWHLLDPLRGGAAAGGAKTVVAAGGGGGAPGHAAQRRPVGKAVEEKNILCVVQSLGPAQKRPLARHRRPGSGRHPAHVRPEGGSGAGPRYARPGASAPGAHPQGTGPPPTRYHFADHGQEGPPAAARNAQSPGRRNFGRVPHLRSREGPRVLAGVPAGDGYAQAVHPGGVPRQHPPHASDDHAPATPLFRAAFERGKLRARHLRSLQRRPAGPHQRPDALAKTGSPESRLGRGPARQAGPAQCPAASLRHGPGRVRRTLPRRPDRRPPLRAGIRLCGPVPGVVRV